MAAVAFSGYYGALSAEERPAPTTPLAYGAAGAPPFLVVHGDNDTYIPVNGARALVEAPSCDIQEPSGAELPGAEHAFDLVHSVRYEAVVDAVEAFAAWVRSSSAATRTTRCLSPQRRRSAGAA